MAITPLHVVPRIDQDLPLRDAEITPNNFARPCLGTRGDFISSYPRMHLTATRLVGYNPTVDSDARIADHVKESSRHHEPVSRYDLHMGSKLVDGITD